MADIKDLIGKILSDVRVDYYPDELTFETTDGATYVMYHEQDCCESVYLEDINGDFADLRGEPILLAEEVVSEEAEEEADEDGLKVWTFYKLGTIKGVVVLRWHGESNGYYSVGVDFELKEGELDDARHRSQMHTT